MLIYLVRSHSFRQQTSTKQCKVKKHFQAIGLSVSLFAASTIALLTSHTAIQAKKAVPRPTVATVKSMVNGDLMCYVNLVDQKGKEYNSVGASFEICAKEKRFLNNWTLD
ncbi:hypothetical protein HW132_21935 [Brasilonema sp. CT11]|nr:hypothetical protein [Brasilonema sp. CT11]